VSLFRRKSQSEEDAAFEKALGETYERKRDAIEELDDGELDEELDGDEEGAAARPVERRTTVSGRPAIDFGAIVIPAVDGMQVRAEMDETENVVAVSVLLDDTMLQMQAFAAPRAEQLWDEVRQEIAEGIRGGQGKAREADGPFGRELQAEVVLDDASGSTKRQPARFIGMDGDRWFLRGVVTGSGATDDARAKAVEEVFAEVEVERGDFAAAPRDLLPLRIPEDPTLVSEPPQ
jgi:hypothetical protein